MGWSETLFMGAGGAHEVEGEGLNRRAFAVHWIFLTFWKYLQDITSFAPLPSPRLHHVAMKYVAIHILNAWIYIWFLYTIFNIKVEIKTSNKKRCISINITIFLIVLYNLTSLLFFFQLTFMKLKFGFAPSIEVDSPASTAAMVPSSALMV